MVEMIDQFDVNHKIAKLQLGVDNDNLFDNDIWW